MPILRFALVSHLGLLTLFHSFQTRVIFPGADTQGQSFAKVVPRPGSRLVSLEAKRGERVVALYGPALLSDGSPDPDAVLRPTMIFFYGNAMCVGYSQQDFDRFRRLGLNVIIPDYIGYGMSGGSPSEKGCQATADAVYDYLVTTAKVDPGTIVSAGWSLGGAVAIDLASRRRVGGLIAFSTFTSGTSGDGPANLAAGSGLALTATPVREPE